MGDDEGRRPGLIALAAALFLVSGLIGSWLWRGSPRQGVVIPYHRRRLTTSSGSSSATSPLEHRRGYREDQRCQEATRAREPGVLGDPHGALIGVVAIGFLAVVASIAALNRLHLYAIYWTTLAVFLVAVALFASVFNRGIWRRSSVPSG